MMTTWLLNRPEAPEEMALKDLSFIDFFYKTRSSPAIAIRISRQKVRISWHFSVTPPFPCPFDALSAPFRYRPNIVLTSPRLALYNDVVLIEQAYNAGGRKLCFFDPVFVRVEGVVISRAQVGFFEIGIVKGGTAKVAVQENGLAKVGLCKIDLLDATVFEPGLFKFEAEKGGEVEYTIIKIHRKQEFAATLKVQAQEFTVFELYIF